jgi:hypothetical protein
MKAAASAIAKLELSVMEKGLLFLIKIKAPIRIAGKVAASSCPQL